MTVDIRDGVAEEHFGRVLDGFIQGIEGGKSLIEVVSGLAGVALNGTLAGAEDFFAKHPDFPEGLLPDSATADPRAIILAVGAALGFAAGMEAQQARSAILAAQNTDPHTVA
jgi:hypothetical protein